MKKQTEKWEKEFRYILADAMTSIINSLGDKKDASIIITERNIVIGFVRNLIQSVRQETIESVLEEVNKSILIHKQLQKECIGGFVENEKKFENPHPFVIEQLELVYNKIIQNAKEKFGIDL